MGSAVLSGRFRCFQRPLHEKQIVPALFLIREVPEEVRGVIRHNHRNLLPADFSFVELSAEAADRLIGAENR